MKSYFNFNAEDRILAWVGTNSFLVTFLKLPIQLKCQTVPNDFSFFFLWSNLIHAFRIAQKNTLGWFILSRPGCEASEITQNKQWIENNEYFRLSINQIQDIWSEEEKWLLTNRLLTDILHSSLCGHEITFSFTINSSWNMRWIV